VTEQTGDVLADIDAALEGWHGTDAISPDAMRWAPEAPPGARRVLTDEDYERIEATCQEVGRRMQAFHEALRPALQRFGEHMRQTIERLAQSEALQAAATHPTFGRNQSSLRGMKVDRIVVDDPAAVRDDQRWAAAMEAVHARGTGPSGPRLDGRRSR
jgi:hypothetical protein